jgi:protease-4
MAIDSDFIIDRRRLKNQLGLWRLAAVGLLVVVALLLAAQVVGVRSGSYIARLDVSGVITGDVDRDAALSDLAKDRRVKALIVTIDSPGGTVVGGQSLFAGFRRIAASKPVVAVMGDVATSAAYMAALGADRIYARDGTVTGSVGVILQAANVEGLLGKLGIQSETIKSSALKAQPNPFETFTPEAREATRQVVLDIYGSFADLVGARRNLAGERLAGVVDGRVFSGRQAVGNGLIDELGDGESARAWLQAAHGIDPDLPLKDVVIRRPGQSFGAWMHATLRKAIDLEGLELDGVLALWHPGLR